VYVGGTEHAVGHLLYSRMWTKVLYDLGYISFDEPFKKLVNQGMITGSSRFVFEVHINGVVRNFKGRIFVSKSHYEKLLTLLDKPTDFVNYVEQKLNTTFDIKINLDVRLTRTYVDVKYVDGIELNQIEFSNSLHPFEDSKNYYINEDDGKYICDAEVEKMSKSKYNTVNPDELCDKYGADTFRIYEMFLGPVEQSKPWDTKGIEGVHRFLKKLWRLFFADISAVPSPLERGKGEAKWTNEAPTEAQYKILHKTIKKIEQDTANFSYNTAVAAFMIAVNELTDAKCTSKAILSQILILLSPYAPHIAEELWCALGCEGSILNATYPLFDEKYLIEASKEYPVSINGKMRSAIILPTEVTEDDAKQAALANENITKWLEGKEVKKFIFVKGRMINIVV
jgi:leucyl-tRNA synthetase